MKAEDKLKNECHNRFKMSPDEYVERLNSNDIKDLLLSLFESQSEIDKRKDKFDSQVRISESQYNELTRLKEDNERLNNIIGHCENENERLKKETTFELTFGLSLKTKFTIKDNKIVSIVAMDGYGQRINSELIEIESK